MANGSNRRVWIVVAVALGAMVLLGGCALVGGAALVWLMAGRAPARSEAVLREARPPQAVPAPYPEEFGTRLAHPEHARHELLLPLPRPPTVPEGLLLEAGPSIIVNVRADGTCCVAGAECSPPVLDAMLARAAESGPATVLVRADRQAAWTRIVPVLEQCSRHGLRAAVEPTGAPRPE